MRLAVFTNQFPGQISTFFARDMRGLLESGIELDVFPIRPLDPSLWRYVPDILSERVFHRHKVHPLPLNRSLVNLLRPGTMWKLGPFMRDAAAICASAVRFGLEPLAKSACVLVQGRSLVNGHFSENQYDHILGYWGNYATTCAYICHRLRAAHIPFSIFLHAGNDLYRTPVYMQEKLLYADNIITCSDFNYQYIQAQFPEIFPLISDKIFVHHHGLDFGEYTYEPENRASKRVIAVGNLVKKKGFDFLLRAMHQLKCSGMDFELELVGTGPQEKSLKELANELGIGEKVIFRGLLTSEEAKSAIRNATMLVHPSPELGDGVPNVIKEAMALGTPVVGSTVAGIPELLGNGRHGILVPPKDTKALANAIEKLMKDEKLGYHYGKSARKFVESKFDLWKNGKRLADRLFATTRRMGVEG